MNARAILDRLQSLGIRVTVSGDALRLEPGSRVPPQLVEELKAHKQDVILLLNGYRLRYFDCPASHQELEQIVETVHREGCVLLWSNVLQDLVAFYSDEESRGKITPGFVPYSEDELWELFGEGKPHPSQQTLRLIHEAKKRAAVSFPTSPSQGAKHDSGGIAGIGGAGTPFFTASRKGRKRGKAARGG